MNVLYKICASLIILLHISACEYDDTKLTSAFDITDCKKINKDQYGQYAKLVLTIKNNSSSELSGWAYIKIKKGNTIIETSSVSFDYLNAGESSIEEALFDKFSNHHEYDQANIKLHWTVDSTGYSKEFNF